MGYGFFAGVSKAIATITLIFLSILALAGDARAQDVTIVAFGDSLTQGYGLPQEDGFVPQLGAWLAENGQGEGAVKLINAGVSGDTTAGGAARIDWTLTEDVDGLIVTLGGNDLLRGIDPAASRTNLDRILQAAQKRGLPVLLVGMVATGNMGPDFKTAFDQMYPELSQTYGTLYAPDFFAGLLEPDGSIDRDAVRARMQSDGIHPNKTGVRDIVNSLGPFVLDLAAQARTAGKP